MLTLTRFQRRSRAAAARPASARRRPDEEAQPGPADHGLPAAVAACRDRRLSGGLPGQAARRHQERLAAAPGGGQGCRRTTRPIPAPHAGDRAARPRRARNGNAPAGSGTGPLTDDRDLREISARLPVAGAGGDRCVDERDRGAVGSSAPIIRNPSACQQRARALCRVVANPCTLVGVAGFEPATPASRTLCSTRLSYTPIAWRSYSGAGAGEASLEPRGGGRSVGAGDAEIEQVEQRLLGARVGEPGEALPRALAIGLGARDRGLDRAVAVEQRPARGRGRRAAARAPRACAARRRARPRCRGRRRAAPAA